MQLAEKVAVITGGGSGIGRAMAERFAREGARVVVADLVAARAEETVALIAGAGGDALTVAADVSDATAVASLAERALASYGRVDILVNNAAVSRGDDIRAIDEAEWDFNLAVVLKSAYLCSRAFVPQMIERRTGAIVNISSVNGLAAFGEEAYSAGKAGMISLTQNMAVKYGQYGVRVNCICPGTVRTPIWASRVAENPQIFDQLAEWYPLGRVGEPEDVANAALFLASDQAAWITGTVLNVDGGLMAGRHRMSRELVGDGE
jgi:meso-butanediol dehydrogenase/(S,S)-butanediol dehydrogenase/diacetyl reductase